MIALTLSITSSGLLFVIFRLFPKYKVHTFHAIVFNYFTALCCGLFIHGSEIKRITFTGNWIWFALLSGLLFISLFLLIGLSAQRNGLALTAISSKLSMGVSLILITLWHQQTISPNKLIGIFLATGGVFLLLWNGKTVHSQNSRWMLPILFFGSGILDVLLNHSQNHYHQNVSTSLFTAFCFGSAGMIGFLCILFQVRHGQKIQIKDLIAGIILGIPNYFSIFLLLKSYSIPDWTDTTVLAITNLSVVIFAFFIGTMAFRESVTRTNIMGLIAAISAMLVFYFADK